MKNATQERFINTDQTLIEALSNGESGRFQELYQNYPRSYLRLCDATQWKQGRCRRHHARHLPSGPSIDFDLPRPKPVFLPGSSESHTTRPADISDGRARIPIRSKTKAALRVSSNRLPKKDAWDALRALKSCNETLARSRQPEHLEIFRLFYAENKPIRIIAEITGKPTDSIKDSLRRSRNLLIRDLPDLKLIWNTAESA